MVAQVDRQCNYRADVLTSCVTGTTSPQDREISMSGSTAVSRKIKEHQDRNGSSVAFIARKVGVSRLTVHTWRNGVHRPQPDRIGKLAEVLGCSEDELID